jgi:hypothetical protein
MRCSSAVSRSTSRRGLRPVGLGAVVVTRWWSPRRRAYWVAWADPRWPSLPSRGEDVEGASGQLEVAVAGHEEGALGAEGEDIALADDERAQLLGVDVEDREVVVAEGGDEDVALVDDALEGVAAGEVEGDELGEAEDAEDAVAVEGEREDALVDVVERVVGVGEGGRAEGDAGAGLAVLQDHGALRVAGDGGRGDELLPKRVAAVAVEGGAEGEDVAGLDGDVAGDEVEAGGAGRRRRSP